jgi:outer membrane lipoprotein-sorting protein
MGQIQPTALEVVNRVSRTYSQVSQYEAEIESSPDSALSSTKKMFIHVMLKAPKFRVETEVLESQEEARLRSLAVYDGSTTWVYNESQNTYVSSRGQAPDLGEVWISEFRDLSAHYESKGGLTLRLAGEEHLELEKGSFKDCVLLDLQYPHETERLWIGKDSGLVLRARHGGATYTFRKIELGKPIDDAAFRFAPPPGARNAASPQ